MRTISAVASLLGVASVWLGAPATLAQAPDPLLADPPHSHLEIQNQWVRAFRERMEPHGMMPLHRHPPPGAVVVFLTARHNRLTPEQGAAQELRNRAWEVVWAPAGTHRGENLTDTPFEAIQIEPRQPTGREPEPAHSDALDAAVVDPQHYHVEFENQYVRVLRAKIGPHEKLRLHTHPRTGAVLVQLTDQSLRLTLADGTARESKYRAGVVRWVEPGPAHQDENLSDEPLEFIRVELKGAAGAASK